MWLICCIRLPTFVWTQSRETFRLRGYYGIGSFPLQAKYAHFNHTRCLARYEQYYRLTCEVEATNLVVNLLSSHLAVTKTRARISTAWSGGYYLTGAGYKQPQPTFGEFSWTYKARNTTAAREIYQANQLCTVSRVSDSLRPVI